MSATSAPLSEEIIELRNELHEYKPGDASKSPDRMDFPQNLYIGLFGKTGCGKTSLINSIKYAADGRLRKAKWEQVAPRDKAGGHTMYRILANITDHIFVIDNRGLDDPNTEQAGEELTLQLEGKRSFDKLVNWQEVDRGSDYDFHPGTGDAVGKHPISCAVLVFSALHDLEDISSGLTEVIDYLHVHQGRYPVAVITHVDVADTTNVEALSTILGSTGVSDIFKVVNLTEEQPKMDEDSQLILLNLMDKCMTDGDETLIFSYNQCKGRQFKEPKGEQRLQIEEQEYHGTKMHFKQEWETSPSSPPYQTSSIGTQEDFDKKLTTVARKVATRDEIDNLGNALGFEPEDIQRYVDTNMRSSEVSYMGTQSMLRKWRKKQTKATECVALKEALEEAGQIHLADELFSSS